jgi:hypothetical protein
MTEKQIANYWYMKGVKDAETTERQPIPIEETLKDFETHFELQYKSQEFDSATTKYAEFCVRCDREGLPLIKLADYIKLQP